MIEKCKVCGEIHEPLNENDLELHQGMWNLHLKMVGMIGRVDRLQAKANEQAVRIGRLGG